MTFKAILTTLITPAAAVALTVLFWEPLWHGGGFVGGDVYSYYLPQKVVYAEALRSGELPLWNNRAGHGYPLVAESQTGPFYPFHLLLYRTLGVNSAYNVNHLVHYAIAFLFTWLYCRRIGLGGFASILAANVYVYGWFPPRACWEWAIIGGAWLPAALWCVEAFLDSRQWRYAILLSVVLALQMLAGHFNLAFLTQLLLIGYIPLRLAFSADGPRERSLSQRGLPACLLVAAMLFGFALSAVQLLPTLELKNLSQRATVGADHKLAHGSIPPWYWSQIVAWHWSAESGLEHWYSPFVDRDAQLQESEQWLGAPTNQVEAHLYFGLIPLGLALIGFVEGGRRRDRLTAVWALLGFAALLYTPGWLLPATSLLPGFNFFQGPGRYGIVTTFAIAVIAAKGLERLRSDPSTRMVLYVAGVLVVSLASSWWITAEADSYVELSGIPHPFKLAGSDVPATLFGIFAISAVALFTVAIVLGNRRISAQSRRIDVATPVHVKLFLVTLLSATLVDLWLVSRIVTYSTMTSDPPIEHLSESPIRRLLEQHEGLPRLFAPGANFPTVLGAASTPAYFTFGPAAYVDAELVMPADEGPEQFDWLRRAGVTHILRTEPLDTNVWPVTPVWSGMDPVVNRAWGRLEPLYLYELANGRGRVSFDNASVGDTAQITGHNTGAVRISAKTARGGRLVVTDLWYPGWRVTVDGEPAAANQFESMYRAVDVPSGEHTVVWSYRPASVYWGAIFSLVALLLLAAVVFARLRQPDRSLEKSVAA
jgi:hypothetical protein